MSVDTEQRERRIANMLKGKHFGSKPYPRLVTAEIAAAYADNSEAAFFSIYWWTDLPAGFTRFVWNESKKPLGILLENMQQTALDKPGELLPGELVLMRGIDIPAGKNVWLLPEGTP